jgi:mono/diheme cytochrome c family protein
MKSLVKLMLVAAIVALSLPAYAADPAIQSLYKTKCAACHAADGTASTPAGKKLETRSFLIPEIMKAPDKELLEITAKGKAKMPAFDKKLSEDQIKGLVAYIRELQKAKK